jgi:excisionase family DNA binding protein
MNTNEKDILTLKEFAEYIHVHPNTVRKMIKTGQLSAFKTGKGKTSSYRIAKSETLRLSLMNFELHKTLGKD